MIPVMGAVCHDLEDVYFYRTGTLYNRVFNGRVVAPLSLTSNASFKRYS